MKLEYQCILRVCMVSKQFCLHQSKSRLVGIRCAIASVVVDVLLHLCCFAYTEANSGAES